MNQSISLIVPFYNEVAGVGAFFNRLQEATATLPKYDFEIIAINDGSRDETLAELIKAREKNPTIRIIDFSRNFGKEAALTAGLDYATGDAMIFLDADLQHPPELIDQMLSQWQQGAEVVLAKRNNRKTDGFLQKVSATLFYRINHFLSDIDIPRDVGDFRLIDKKVAAALKLLPENKRFMKGLFAWVGFRTVSIPYDVAARETGQSSFHFWKLWNFALEGITSFSTVPLRIWTYIGASISFFSILYAMVILFKTLFYGSTVPGYASVMIAVLVLSGVQILSIGILGEYIGRIYMEAKQRPIYIVREEFKNDD